jgi:tetratricopeptide (TPR) repeat protein
MLLRPSGQFEFNFDGDRAATVPDLACPAPAVDWFERGRSLEAEENYLQAETAYRKAIELDPADPECHFNLGNVLRELGQIHESIVAFESASRFDPSMAIASYNLADVLEQLGKMDSAIDHLRNAVRISPGFADAHYNLAYCLDAVGRREDAEKHWRAFLQLEPHGDSAVQVRARLCANR